MDETMIGGDGREIQQSGDARPRFASTDTQSIIGFGHRHSTAPDQPERHLRSCRIMNAQTLSNPLTSAASSH
jgi:hypothetical protein